MANQTLRDDGPSGEVVRFFTGADTHQVDGVSGEPAVGELWYYEPWSYEGDVLWSRGYPTIQEAWAAAESEPCEEENHT